MYRSSVPYVHAVIGVVTAAVLTGPVQAIELGTVGRSRFVMNVAAVQELIQSPIAGWRDSQRAVELDLRRLPRLNPDAPGLVAKAVSDSSLRVKVRRSEVSVNWRLDF